MAKSDKELQERYVDSVKEFYMEKFFVVSIYSALWGTVKGIVTNSEYSNAEIGQRIRALVAADEIVKQEMWGNSQCQESEELVDEPEL